ncbi:hypothetical protein [Ramlibacter henchirensis]|uniref:hypothetical protein n=1 Tax=Ramlibacter henchirensis TaxID=204072 RepID=UPI0010762AAF|nr:hypothetical protein [Ramlibacter henchirensis]
MRHRAPDDQPDVFGPECVDQVQERPTVRQADNQLQSITFVRKLVYAALDLCGTQVLGVHVLKWDQSGFKHPAD